MNNPSPEQSLRWYQGISRYQWLVLTIASLGWVFDVFEGQIFVASMREAMPALLNVAPNNPLVSSWNDWAFGSFLLGGAFGGVLFGVLGDRIGRSKTMVITILFYSLFTCITAFAQSAWQMVILRFFVAMGVGGEWAVASAMVAEVMPQRSRSVMSSIFHASSVFGTILAAMAGALVVGNASLGESAWRWGFAIGVLPALLTVWIRMRLAEPPQWLEARRLASTKADLRAGRVSELFTSKHVKNTLIAVTLSSIGLVTYWGVHISGKDVLLRHAEWQILREAGVAADANNKQQILAEHKSSIKNAEMLSMILNSFGGGLGLVLFGTISNYLGRKGAFVFYQAVAFLVAVLMFQVVQQPTTSVWIAMIALPIFGFFTTGMHAGYAVYFPELYPTRLRGTGSGFCFNMGRLATGVAFVVFGVMTIPTDQKPMLLAPLFLVGVVVVLFASETRDSELPE